MLNVSEKNELSEKDIKNWGELWGNIETAHFFNSYSWYIACREGLKQKIHIWYVYCEKALIGVFPLCKTSRYGIECWGIIGKPYTDKCSILFHSDYCQFLSQIFQEIGKKTPVVLEEVPETWKFDDSNPVLLEVASFNPFVNLDEDILCQVKRKEWNSIKRKSEKNGFYFKILYAKDVQNNIHVLWEIENQSSKPSKKRAMFETELTKNFFQKISDANECVLAILYDGEKPIAHMFGYNIKDKFFHAHHMSFVQEYSKETPGKLVIYRLICHLKEKGVSVFDFSRGETMLKKHFSIYRETHYDFYYNCSAIVKKWFEVCKYIKGKCYDVRHSVKNWYMLMKGKG
ncbi:MAG: GNAT family N-acetyltransferase [Lachnospiraceae bacterium]